MFSRQELPEKDVCPLLKGACIRHRCKWYKHIVGKDPNTGAQVDEFDCAVSWMPILILEAASRSLSTAAAVESLRNELVGAVSKTLNLALGERVATALLGRAPESSEPPKETNRG